MLAIALVLDGVDRKTAAENCGMDRQTLRDWAHRYNAEGVSGVNGGVKTSQVAAQKSATVDMVHIPGYPPTYSDNIRPFVPGYPPSFDALP